MEFANKEFTQIPEFSDYYICKYTSEILSIRSKVPYIMIPAINSTKSNSTYYMVRIINDAGKTCKKYIHRLMAELFLCNPDNKKQVNHIDGNKHNNDLSNLEWVTHQENAIHAVTKGLTPTVKVSQYSKDGSFIASYSSIIEAERVTGVHNPNITKVLKGKRKSAGGFIWKLT